MESTSLLNLPLGKHPGSYLNDALKVDLLEGSYRRGSQLCGLILRVVKENGYDKLRHSQLSSCAYGIICGYGKI